MHFLADFETASQDILVKVGQEAVSKDAQKGAKSEQLKYWDRFIYKNMTYKTILQTIGKTPLVRLHKLSPDPQIVIVHHIIHEAEKSVQIGPGTTLIEATSGNTSAALARV